MCGTMDGATDTLGRLCKSKGAGLVLSLPKHATERLAVGWGVRLSIKIYLKYRPTNNIT